MLLKGGSEVVSCQYTSNRVTTDVSFYTKLLQWERDIIKLDYDTLYVNSGELELVIWKYSTYYLSLMPFSNSSELLHMPGPVIQTETGLVVKPHTTEKALR